MKGNISFKKIYSSSSDILNTIPNIVGYSLSSLLIRPYIVIMQGQYFFSFFFQNLLLNALILHNSRILAPCYTYPHFISV